MDIAYFIMNNIKYIFDYNKYKLEIYRLVNNEKYSLTEEEREYFNNILKKSSSYIFNTDELNNVVSTNTTIDNSRGIVDLINYLESIIPTNCRGNLYNNLKTLSVIEVEQQELSSEDVPASYDAESNTIKINYNHHLIKDDEVKRKEVILHELIHMASSHYDKENDIVYSGFHKIDNKLADDDMKKYRDSALGLTEGLTERLASSIVSSIKPGEFSGAYVIEQMLLDQLACIVGDNVLIDAFFNNKGISYIKENLSSINNNKSEINCMFCDIETDHLTRDKGTNGNSLCLAQIGLISLFEEKCKRLLADAYSSEEVNKQLHETLNRYHLAVIDTHILEIAKINSSKYDYLDESAKKFYDINRRFDMILPSVNGDDMVSGKRMGYIKIGILAVVTTLLCLSLLILGITFK